jgi:hypothetical protein
MLEIKEYTSSYLKGCLDLTKKYTPLNVPSIQLLLKKKETKKLVAFDGKLKGFVVGLMIGDNLHISYICGEPKLFKAISKKVSPECVGYFKHGLPTLFKIKVRRSK